jgi:hypothetical protein
MTSENNNTSIELQAKKDLIVSNSIIRIIGVFEKKGSKKMDACLIEHGFEKEINHDPYSFHKNYWYPEFRDLMFLQKEDTSTKVWKKIINKKIVLENTKSIPFNVDLVELFLFPNGLNFFTIEVSIDDSRLESYSDLTNSIRNFYSKIKSDEDNDKNYKWVNWIEDNCLFGNKLENVAVDEYSGSKFKLFTIYETVEDLDSTTRDELLFDLGCVSPLGSAGGNENLSPDEKYYYELMQDKVSVFKNYEILPLFDSFTCLGTNFLDKDSFKRKTWTDTYFRIVLYNLFLKYNLFRYNSKMNTDSSVKIRDEFEDFLNTYNISHISYNFLPNLIAEKHRKSLHIDVELEHFQIRINRITQEIQEKEQKRSNLLLSFVGLVTSLSGVQPILEFTEEFRQKNLINPILFYSLSAIVLLVISIPLINFLFPTLIKNLKRKWKKNQN